MKKLLFLFLLYQSLLPGQQFRGIDSVFNMLNKKKVVNNTIIARQLLFLGSVDRAQLLKMDKRFIDLAAKSGNKYLYAYFLYNDAWLQDFPTERKMLSKAFSIAKQNNYLNLLGVIDEARGIDFKENSMFDSAMTYSLRAKTILEKVGDTYTLVDVLLTIGDLHFDSGLYDKAEQIYREIMMKKGEPIGWAAWRKVVILNDLGLIRIKQGRYSDAKKYFQRALAYKLSSTKNHLSFNDSLQVEYSYRKLMEVSLLLNKKDEAEKYYKLSIPFAKYLNFPGELASLYIDKGNLDFNNEKYAAALAYYKMAQFYNNKSANVENSLNLYDSMSKTYSSLNDYKNAVKFFGMYKSAKDSFDSTFYQTRYMTTYAEYKYNNYLREIAHDKKINILLSIIIIIVLSSLIIITFYYIRLKKSKQRLVEKSIELATTDPYKVTSFESPLSTEEPEVNGKGLSDAGEINEVDAGNNENIVKSKVIDEELLNNIIEKLERKVSEDKIYLDPELTITSLAEILGTNRTYLSKAIIHEYKMNFISYINELRIKEAIRFITYGEHYNLNMDGIAQKAGFNNRVSFTNTFQKYTGVSPSFFIKNAGAGIGISKD